MKNHNISVIIPCFNEEEGIRETWRRITAVMEANHCDTYEMIFVNDGSVDGTLSILKEISETDNHVKIISFSRNFGHEAATAAGLNHVSGDISFILDADLQDPPELFPEMVELYEKEKCDVVYGVRKSRDGETFTKKLTSKLFYRLFNYLSEVKFPVDTGDFRLVNKKVTDEFKKLNEKNKYVRGLLTWVGFKQVPFLYERKPRLAGTSKYNYKKLLNLALHITFSFSKRPLKLATNLGFICLAFSLFLVLYVIISKYTRPLDGWASTLIIIIFFGGVQLLTLGIVGEYLSIIFDEVKNRPEYVIDETFNMKKSNQ